MVSIAALTSPYEPPQLDVIARASPLRMPRLIVLPHRQHLRLNQLDEIPGLLRKILPLPDHHAITARRKIFRQRSCGEAGAVGVGEADGGDDADAQAHRHVLLDDFPAADFEPSRVE
jgi:hypothetical protein